jgi:hypothetical protein
MALPVAIAKQAEEGAIPGLGYYVNTGKFQN